MKQAVYAIVFFLLSAAGAMAQDTMSVQTPRDTQAIILTPGDSQAIGHNPVDTQKIVQVPKDTQPMGDISPDTLLTGDSVVFCRSVFSIIESSRKSFSDIKGGIRKEQDNFHGRKIQYNVLTSFPKAVCSYIESDINQRYQCVMDSGMHSTPQLQARLAAMSKELKSCLGDHYTFNFIENKAEGTALFQAHANDIYDPNITLRLKDEEGIYVLILEVSEPFFKRK